MCDHDGRYEAGRRADKVDDAVQRTGKVGRQVLRVLQIGQRRGAVEAE